MASQKKVLTRNFCDDKSRTCPLYGGRFFTRKGHKHPQGHKGETVKFQQISAGDAENFLLVLQSRPGRFLISMECLVLGLERVTMVIR